MAFCDFVVKYDPSKDTPADLTKRVIYSIFIKRLKHKKPCIIFLGGDSGEGKSESSITLQDIALEVQGLDLKDYFSDINVYTPLEYPQKLEALLFDKRLKKVNFITMHEAREIVKAKNWQSFLTQSIADVNAMSRAIKRLGIIIISQFIRDIASDIRYTLNYYIKVTRPKGKLARLYISVLWKDDRDLEKPRLRKRKLSGYLVSPKGRYRRYVPEYLELHRPRKELIDIFEKEDTAAKSAIIKKKMGRLIKEMQEDVGIESDKVNTMVDFYSEHQENLTQLGKRRKGKIKLTEDFKAMHGLDKLEAKRFEERLAEKLKAKGLIIADRKEEDINAPE